MANTLGTVPCWPPTGRPSPRRGWLRPRENTSPKVDLLHQQVINLKGAEKLTLKGAEYKIGEFQRRGGLCSIMSLGVGWSQVKKAVSAIWKVSWDCPHQAVSIILFTSMTTQCSCLWVSKLAQRGQVTCPGSQSVAESGQVCLIQSLCLLHWGARLKDAASLQGWEVLEYPRAQLAAERPLTLTPQWFTPFV